MTGDGDETRIIKVVPGSSIPVVLGKSVNNILQSVSVMAGDGELSGSKDTRGSDKLLTTEVSEHDQVGIRACPPPGKWQDN